MVFRCRPAAVAASATFHEVQLVRGQNYTCLHKDISSARSTCIALFCSWPCFAGEHKVSVGSGRKHRRPFAAVRPSHSCWAGAGMVVVVRCLLFLDSYLCLPDSCPFVDLAISIGLHLSATKLVAGLGIEPVQYQMAN